MTGVIIPDRVAEIRRHANTGGPMSRTRTEVMASTLLGRDEYPIRCPRIVRLGIAFPDADPVELLTQMIAEEGYGSPEDLRDALEIPQGASSPGRTR